MVGLRHGDGAVVIAVIAVGVMQMTVHQVVHMVPVGDCRVSAVRTMHVRRIVARAVMRHASVGIRPGDGYGMLVIVALMGAVQVTIVQVPDVIVVLDGDVPAAWAVRVVVVLMDGVGHESCSSVWFRV